MPCLVDNGEAYTESDEVVNYVEYFYPEPTLSLKDASDKMDKVRVLFCLVYVFCVTFFLFFYLWLVADWVGVAASNVQYHHKVVCRMRWELVLGVGDRSLVFAFYECVSRLVLLPSPKSRFLCFLPFLIQSLHFCFKVLISLYPCTIKRLTRSVEVVSR